MVFETPSQNGFKKIRIDEWCAYLGYSREETCGRSWYKLSHATAVFRKSFIKKTPGLEEGTFPINTEDTVARQCAESFAESHRNLFQCSAEALKRGWPTYPRDKSKIVLGVVTLMCFQEINWRKNENHKESVQARERAQNFSPTAEAPPKKRHRSNEDYNERLQGSTITVDPLGFTNAEMHASIQEPRTGQFNETHKFNDGLPRDTWDWSSPISPPPTNSIPDPTSPTPAMDIEPPEQMESSAIFSPLARESPLSSAMSSPCRVEEPTSAIHISTPTVPSISTENEILPWDSTLCNRSESSRSSVAPIVEASELFRASLLKLKSSLAIGAMLPPKTSEHDQQIINSTLAHNEAGIPADSNNNISTSTRSSPVVECLPTSSGPTNSDHGRPDNIISSASMEESLILLPSQGQSNPAAVCQNNTSLPSPISRSDSVNMPTTTVEHTPLPSNVPVSMDLTVVNEAPSRSYAHNRSALQTHQPIQSNGAPVVANGNSIKPVTPKRPTLQFAIQDVDGTPDDDPAALVSFEQLSNFSLADIFTLVATRSGQPLEALAQVTFICQWDNMIALVANRDAGEEAWEKIQRKLKFILKNEPRRYPWKTMFLVCVYVGDYTILKVDPDDNEGMRNSKI